MKQTICILLALCALSVANAACTDDINALETTYENVEVDFGVYMVFPWPYLYTAWYAVYANGNLIGSSLVSTYDYWQYNVIVEQAACEALDEALNVLVPRGPQQ